jgi:hypothetical protein
MATPFPTITTAMVGTSARGSTVLTLTLENVGKVEVTLEQLLRPKLFAKAVLKQTGRAVTLPPKAHWHGWLNGCVAQARRNA